MSKILDKLREAEAHREQIIAERKRLEAEADAALAAHEIEERSARPGAGRNEAQSLVTIETQRLAAAASSSGRAGIAIGAVLLLCLAIGVLYFKQEPELNPKPQGAFELKLDRDLESFAKRLPENEKP